MNIIDRLLYSPSLQERTKIYIKKGVRTQYDNIILIYYKKLVYKP
jgi:hypothetical protein